MMLYRSELVYIQLYVADDDCYNWSVRRVHLAYIVNFVSEKNITLGKLFFPYQLFVSKALN